MCPVMEDINRSFRLRLGDVTLTFGSDNNKTWDFGRTKDGVRESCREYDWEQTTLGWRYGDNVNVRITR